MTVRYINLYKYGLLCQWTSLILAHCFMALSRGLAVTWHGQTLFMNHSTTKTVIHLLQSCTKFVVPPANGDYFIE